MSNITNSSPIVTEDKLKDFYEDIKPFLGCPAYITQEGNSEYYSTDEKVIGRWTDGKPLYQKTIKNTSLTVIAKSAWTTYANVSSLHIDSLVGASFGRLTSGGNKEDDMSDVCFWTDGTNLQANSRGEGTNTPNGSVVTIKYTKTTDSAVTTVDQDPNKYSTEEKIIGEWIDGKPIYQKTFQFNNMTIDGTQQNFGSLSGLNIGNYAEVIRSTLNEENYWTNPGILCVWIRVPQNNFGVKMVDGVSRHGTLYFTIQYTKSTD